ncbi:GatB/YqeY domain-containing protein [bacterium]|nr:GatB/YqeY domain-containing protein [bacterium]
MTGTAASWQQYPPHMSIAEELSTELKDAMRARDKERLAVIRNVQTEVARARSEPKFTGDPGGDDLYLSVLKSYTKRMDKAREEYVELGGRGAGQAAKLAYEVEYLSRWLPTSLGEDETRAIVREAIAAIGATDPAMTGQVIGTVMKSGREGLDGGLVNRLVREELTPG